MMAFRRTQDQPDAHAGVYDSRPLALWTRVPTSTATTSIASSRTTGHQGGWRSAPNGGASGRHTVGGGRAIPADSESYLTPEARARREIDRQLAAAAWAVQDADQVNLAAAQDVALTMTAARLLGLRSVVSDHGFGEQIPPP